MKSLLLLISLLMLASCGGGGGGGNGGKGGSQGNTIKEESTECLEKKLQWSSYSYLDLRTVIMTMENSEFEKCPGLEKYAKEMQSMWNN